MPQPASDLTLGWGWGRRVSPPASSVPQFPEPRSLQRPFSAVLRGPRVGGTQVLRCPQGPQQPCSLAASPVVKPLPSVVQALAEEEVLLPCEATGVPRPRITWQKEGLGIPTGESPLRPAPEGGEHDRPGDRPPPAPPAPPTTQSPTVRLSARWPGQEIGELTAWLGSGCSFCAHSVPSAPCHHSESPAA